MGLILINDLNALASSHPRLRARLHQVVLTRGAADVVAHLQQRRLAHVDHAHLRQMVRTDLAGLRACSSITDLLSLRLL